MLDMPEVWGVVSRLLYWMPDQTHMDIEHILTALLLSVRETSDQRSCRGSMRC